MSSQPSTSPLEFLKLEQTLHGVKQDVAELRIGVQLSGGKLLRLQIAFLILKFEVHPKQRFWSTAHPASSPSGMARPITHSSRIVVLLQTSIGNVGPTSVLEEHRERILQSVQEDPGQTLAQRQVQLALPGCVTTLWSALQRWGITLKKVLQAAEQLRPDVQQKHRWWAILVPSRSWHTLVFLDETGADTKMTRRYGWGLKSSRVIGQVPHGHWKTTTFVAALRATGVTAPLVLDGPMNGECFLAYVRQFLVPTLQRGDSVIMDNLSSHKQSGVLEPIRHVGADVCDLPPYSPDLNPIEKLFAKLKTLLRTHAERTTQALWNRIGTLVDAFTPSECLNSVNS